MESGEGAVRCLIGKHTRRKSFEPAVDIQVMAWMCDSTGRRGWLLFACANAMSLAAGSRKPVRLRQGGGGWNLAGCSNPAEFCPFVTRPWR